LQKQEKTRKVVLAVAVIAVAVVALVAGVVWMRYQTSQTIASSTQATCKSVKQVGKGEFVLPIVDRNGLTGRKLDLSNYRCKVVVLEFMGPWCPPCQELVPGMETLYNQYAGKGVVFIAVVWPYDPKVNAHYQDVSITQFLNDHNSSLTYVLDSGRTLADTYNVTSVPTLFVISKSGTIYGTYVGSGPASSPDVAKDIDEALSEPEPP
jgi:thiol-disulfide isomerase/thioredoxin